MRRHATSEERRAAAAEVFDCRPLTPEELAGPYVLRGRKGAAVPVPDPRTVYLGIDPGLFGAIALVTGPGEARVWDTPTLEVARQSGSGTTRKAGKRTVYAVATMAALLREAVGAGAAVVVLEVSHPHPGEGVVAAAAIARGQALWEGLVVALGLPLETVTPTSWKRRIGLPTGADKDASRLLAMRLFPGLEGELRRKKDHGRAEALLLAEYRRRLG